MDARDIIAEAARLRAVEKTVARMTKVSPLTPDLQDLCQMVWEALLAYDAAKIAAAWEDGGLAENGGLTRLIVAVVRNQYFSTHSPWYYTLRRYGHLAYELHNDDSDDQEDE